MPTLTTQQCYNRIRKYFTAKGAVLAKRPATAEEEANGRSITQCLYRMTNHTTHKCAAGCLLPDSMYDADRMEGKAFNYVYNNILTVAQREQFRLDFRAVSFIKNAQRSHDADNTVTVEQFVALLDRLAFENKLRLSQAAKANVHYPFGV